MGYWVFKEKLKISLIFYFKDIIVLSEIDMVVSHQKVGIILKNKLF